MMLLIQLVDLVFNIFIFIIIAQVVVNWLIVFDVININNANARKMVEALDKITAPIYRPLRKIIPSIGGIDITPIIVLIGLNILQNIIVGGLLHA